ncbi:MAG: DNA polymerase III subunit delta [Bacteroidales bacterium]|nr:DNA polymerase III subunit delta [Bacteroidales bacterium]
MQFSGIIGQQAVKEKLVQTVRDSRISHAQLFLGPEGCGKLALAIAYAQFINCTGRTPDMDDSCGTCPSCYKFEQLAHPDLHFVYPVAATKDVPKKPVSKSFVSKWRSLLLDRKGYINLAQWYDTIGIENKQGIINADDCNEIIKTLSYKSYEAQYKVMIIWMVEKLFHAAAPKILKILEEPPDKTLFLLVAEEPGQIISTILSRTQLVKVKKLSDDDIRTSLIKNYGVEPKNAHKAALVADGNIIEALDFLADEGSEEYFIQFRQWMRLCLKVNIVEVNNWISGIVKMGREKQKVFLAYGSQILRESLAVKLQGEDILRREGEEREFVLKFTRTISSQFIPDLSQKLNEAAYHIERNANPSILFMDLSLKINRMLKSR